MSLFVASLNSGSNGNCYYAGNANEAVLVDVGISCRETERRMRNLNLDMGLVKAIFISHEHGDHISGVAVLSKKYGIPVYITPATLRNSNLWLEESLVRSFYNEQPVLIGELAVTPFQKLHDAADPYSFIVECNGIKAGVITDIGAACNQVTYYFKQCHAAFLESNYDVRMLNEGRYPYHLKKRISGGKGHLSNTEALALFKSHSPEFMTHLFLSHLSKDNNDPALVEQLFTQHANGVNIVIAGRYKETAVYEINGAGQLPMQPPVVIKQPAPAQLALF